MIILTNTASQELAPETVTIVNTGATTVIVENPSLFIKRVA